MPLCLDVAQFTIHAESVQALYSGVLLGRSERKPLSAKSFAKIRLASSCDL
jgi:hypothetical protein